MVKKGRGSVRSYRITSFGEEMPTLRSTAQHKLDLEVCILQL